MTLTQSSWRNKAAPIIEKVLTETSGKTEAEIRAALKDAYPFNERKYHPYKIWLDEIKRQRGKKWPIGHKLAWQNNQRLIKTDRERLQEWESLYGKRTA